MVTDTATSTVMQNVFIGPKIILVQDIAKIGSGAITTVKSQLIRSTIAMIMAMEVDINSN